VFDIATTEPLPGEIEIHTRGLDLSQPRRRIGEQRLIKSDLATVVSLDGRDDGAVRAASSRGKDTEAWRTSQRFPLHAGGLARVGNLVSRDLDLETPRGRLGCRKDTCYSELDLGI